MTNYPNLPCPLLSSGTYNTSSTFNRSGLGYYNEQHRKSRGAYTTEYSTIMTIDELTIFRTWVVQDLRYSDYFSANWEIEGKGGIKIFKFLDTYTVQSLSDKLFKVNAPLEMISNLEFTVFRTPVVITDFTASDDEIDKITYSWTRSINTITHDLYKDGVLHISDVSSPYTETGITNTDINSYKLKLTNKQGISYSNIDDGSAVDHQISIVSDLTGNLTFETFGGGCEIDIGDGVYNVFPEGQVGITPTGLTKIKFGVDMNRIKFYTSIDNNALNRLNSITLYDCSALTDCTELLREAINVTEVNIIDGTTLSNVTNFDAAFQQIDITSLDYIDTSSATSFIQMFDGCSNLLCIDNIDTTNQTDTTDMFKDCTSLIAPDANDQIDIIAGSEWINPENCP